MLLRSFNLSVKVLSIIVVLILIGAVPAYAKDNKKTIKIEDVFKKEFCKERPRSAPKYLGDICWDLDYGDNEQDILKLGITCTGTHYLVAGKITNLDDNETLVYPAHGNAEKIDGSTVFINLHVTEIDPFIVPSSMQINLSLPDLNGIFEELITESNDGTTYFFDRKGGTVTRIDCP